MTRDEKIKAALSKQADKGSPYANDRHERISMQSSQCDSISLLADKMKEFREKTKKINNVVHVDFKNKTKKNVLTVDHSKGLITAAPSDMLIDDGFIE